MELLVEALRWLLILVGLFMVVGSAAGRSTGSAWWLRAWDFPRLHIASIAAGAGSAYLVFYFAAGAAESAFVALCFAAAGWQLWRVYPYTPLAPQEVADAGANGAQVSIVTSNVLMENTQYARWLERVSQADADIVLALEVDQRWHRAISGLEHSHPHCLRQIQDNYYGMALYSRLPLVNPQLRFLVEDDIPSIRSDVELADGQRLRLYALHPRPPEPLRGQDSAPRDAELVLVGREIADHDGPTIVIGDFNDVAWSRTTRLFQRLSRLLDPRKGRGLFNTFPAHLPWLRFPLDHVFHSDHFTLLDIRCLPPVGSDHLPVSVRLRLEPGAKAQQDAPQPEAGDAAEAEEKLERTAAARQ